MSLAILITAAPLSAQDQVPAEPAETTAAPDDAPVIAADNVPGDEARQSGAPIIVTADKSEQRSVLVGSRIPRRAVFVDGPIATSTGTRGLTPGSGMDPAGQYSHTKRSRACVSDNIALSKAASCIMADAQEAFDAGELSAASDRYAVITNSPQFAPAERIEAARWQYRIAQQQGDDTAREAALLAMVSTGMMDPDQELSARRVLVGLARSGGRTNLAMERLADLDSTGDARTLDLVRLAMMMRQAERTGAEDVMLRAIAMQEAGGDDVPQGWLDFANRVGL